MAGIAVGAFLLLFGAGMMIYGCTTGNQWGKSVRDRNMQRKGRGR